MQTPVMIAADPNRPAIMRCVRLLYFLIGDSAIREGLFCGPDNIYKSNIVARPLAQRS